MREYSKQNKTAWEYNAYEFWIKQSGTPEERAKMDVLHLETMPIGYFSTDIFEAEMAHARFYPEEVRSQMPKCSLRKYTVSEIINGVIGSGFIMERFDEHPAWENDKVPGEFTIVARK